MTVKKRTNQTKFLPKTSRAVIILNVVFFASLLLNLVNLGLFEKTFIRIGIIGLCYLVGVFVFFLFQRRLKEISSWGNFSDFVFCFLVVGSCLTFLILGPNYYFAERQSLVRSYKILAKREINDPKYYRGNTTPSVDIAMTENYHKRIEFKRKFRKAAYEADSVVLTLCRGFLNFDIIEDKRLK